MTNTLDEVLNVLKDGEWHSVRELMTCVSPMNLERVLVFLSEFKFVEWNKKIGQVKLSYCTLDFLQRLFGIRIEKWYERGRRVV